MNDEAAVVNLFFTVRVFIVGTILFVLPRISRKGLVLGAYYGEEAEGSAVVAGLRRTWDLGTAAVMATSLAVGWGISSSGHAVRGNLTGTVVLLTSGLLLYVGMYLRARALAPQNTALPDRIPTQANVWGYGEGIRAKGFVAVLLVPSYNLVLGALFAGVGLLVANAKRTVRGGSGGGSAEAQLAFRTNSSVAFSGTAVFTSLMLAVYSLDLLRAYSGTTEAMVPRFLLVGIPMIVFVAVILTRILRIGQGGARVESGSTEAPLAGGITENERWVMGLWYVDRDDPSLVVEGRFFGYSMNYGNGTAIVLAGAAWLAMASLAVLTLMEAGVI